MVNRARHNPCAIDDYLHAVYFLTFNGTTHEFSFVRNSLPASEAVSIDVPRPWAIVSACNPMSVKLSDAENEARGQVLAGTLQRRGVPRGPAGGRNAEGTWNEPSRVVFGMSREEVLTLARQFEQRAVVWAGSDGVGILDCLSERLVRRAIYGR